MATKVQGPTGPRSKVRSAKGVRLAQNMEVAPCIPVGIQLQKAEGGPTSGPTWRLSHSRVQGSNVRVPARTARAHLRRCTGRGCSRCSWWLVLPTHPRGTFSRRRSRRSWPRRPSRSPRRPRACRWGSWCIGDWQARGLASQEDWQARGRHGSQGRRSTAARKLLDWPKRYKLVRELGFCRGRYVYGAQNRGLAVMHRNGGQLP